MKYLKQILTWTFQLIVMQRYGWRIPLATAIVAVMFIGCPGNSRQKMDATIVKQFGKGSRLMRGDDAESQAIIDRYWLAECRDDPAWEKDPNDKYKSGWRPWLMEPFPPTYTLRQNPDGTYHLRYKP
jgi:hypothetical protein